MTLVNKSKSKMDNDILEACSRYLETCLPPKWLVSELEAKKTLFEQSSVLLLDMPVDFSSLKKETKLTELILEDSNIANEYFIEVLLPRIQRSGNLKNLDRAQIHLQLRLNALPAGYRSHVPDHNKLTDVHWKPNKFLHFRVTIMAVSTIKKYIKSAHYHCSNEVCPFSEKNDVVILRLFQTGVKEESIFGKLEPCDYCGMSVVEVLPLRLMSDKVLITAVDQRALGKSSWPHHQSLNFVIRDDLINHEDLKPGRRVSLIALPVVVKLENQITIHFEVNNIVPEQPAVSPHSELWTAPIDSSKYSSPWTLALTLAKSFASSIVPDGPFFSMKLSILMSLLNSHLNVLAVGVETSTMSSLFDYSINLFASADRPCLRHQYWLHHDLSHSIMPHNYYWSFVPADNMQVVEAGSLMLAANGVCYVSGNIRILPKAQLDELLKTLETRSMNVTKKEDRALKPFQLSHASKRGKIQNIASVDDSTEFSFKSVPLSCSVWAIYDTSYDSKSMTRESKRPADLKSDRIIGFFELVNFTDPLNEDAIRELLNYKLSIPHSENVFSDQQIVELINLAREKKPHFTQEIRSYLQDIFITYRHLYREKVPSSAITTLFNMTKSIAMLSLRDTVSVHDCTLAAYLYQNMLSSRYDELPDDQLMIKRINHLSNDPKLYKVQSHLISFEKSLMQLCQSYTS